MAQNPIPFIIHRPGSDPEPPPGLSSHGQRIWREVLAEFEILDAARLELLRQAGEAIDRAEALIARDGLTTVNPETGAIKAHPAIVLEMSARALGVRLLRQLGVLDPPKRDRPGRPPGQGAA
jgi:phage terminase small subunit